MNFAGENFLTPAPGAGQASPKTVKNGVRPASQKVHQNEPKMEQKPAQNWPENGPGIEPFWRAEKHQNALFSLCFRLKRAPEGGPKEPQKRAQNGAIISPKMSRNLGRKGAKRGVKRGPNPSKS